MRAIDIRRLERVAKKYAEIEALLNKIENYTYIHDEPFNKNVGQHRIVCLMLDDAHAGRSYVEGKINAIKEMNDENQLIISVIKNGEENNIPETEGEA